MAFTLLILICLLLFVFTNLPKFLDPRARAEWEISPYPGAYDFAFTIVHDADDAYSERLRPLFKVFDRHGFKLSVTVFAFWGNDTINKRTYETSSAGERFYKAKAVPLEVKSEELFYRGLSSNGHEIGMHSASNLSDNREDTERAFEYFRTIFGYYPKIYVEHRDDDNKECLQKEGADPESKYYIVDILNRYGPWVWVIAPSALPYNGKGDYFNLLDKSTPIFSDTALKYWGIVKGVIRSRRISAENGEMYLRMVKRGTPFDEYVLRKYGVIKGFRRSGKRVDANGDGFLRWYSRRNIDKLEKDHGVALVYTHLNSRWLNLNTAKMRRSIEERLEYIASKNVWLAPASEILERFQRISYIHICYNEKWVTITNSGSREVNQLTLISRKAKSLVGINGERLAINDKNKIVVGDIMPGETLIFRVSG